MPPDSSFTSDSDREIVLKETLIAHRRDSNGPKYVCSISGCSESFKRLDHLDRHEYHHTGIKKHICAYDGCDKTYSILTHLKRHLRTTHERTASPVKNVTCMVEECGKLFQSVSNMQRHVREVHENPKVYNCSYCNEQFTQKLKMRRHEISKHTKEYPYNCEKCSKGFYQEWQFEKHIPSCKVYPCTGCELKFDKWSNYIKHCKEMQHGRKYYNCEHCPRIYAKPGELQRHIMLQHVDSELALNYKCMHEGCERAYAYERNLRQHIKTAHSGKRFACKHEGCTRDFTSAQNQEKHIIREHGTLKRMHISCSEAEATEKRDAIKTNEPKPAKKKRKDAGKPRISNLAAVSGIIVERDFDKLLCEREANAVQAVSDHLLANMSQEPSSSEFEQDSAISKTLDNSANEETQLENMIALVLED